MSEAACEHAGMYWYAAPANERGWKCVDCELQPGEPPGFSPAHDRELIMVKVSSILDDLHNSSIVYVSNGMGGDILTLLAAEACVARQLYDSVSIARVILEMVASDDHAKFWRDISEGILAGNDPRHRCACGQLARMSSGAMRACSAEHLETALGGAS